MKKAIMLYDKTKYISHFVLSCLMVWSIFKLIVCHNYYSFISYPYLLILLICISIVLYNIIYSLIKKEKLEKLFLLLAIPIGLAFMFLQPPNFKPDEPHHVYKSYDITTGHLMPNRDENNISEIYVPVDALNFSGNNINNLNKLNNILNSKTDYTNVARVSSTAAGYSPISYVFSSLGMFIGRNLNLSWTWTYYLSRCLNFLSYLFIGYISIKIIPMCKLLVFTLLLNPMFIHQATAISGDVLLNSLSILYICYLLYIRFVKEKVKITDVTLLYVMVIICSLIKITYFPLVFLMVLIPKKKIMSKKSFCITNIVYFICFLLFIFIHFNINSYDNESIYMNPLINGGKQLSNILNNPLQYIKVLYNTFMTYSEFYLTSFSGKYLSWIDVENTSLVAFLYLFIFLFSVFIHEKDTDFKKDKVMNITMIIVFILSLGVLFTGVYLQWNIVNYHLITGIQGRYFIPIALLIIIPFYNNNNNIRVKYNNIIYSSILIFINVIMLVNLINVYI